MVGRGRSSSVRRLLTAVAALTIATAGVHVAPERAAAVRAVPWRFASVYMNSSISGAFTADPSKGWVLQCPAGYTAVSGGIVGGDEPFGIRRLLEYPNPADGTYHIIGYNESINGTTVELAATCVWLDDVGTITTVYDEFTRNGSGRAGGIVRCPEGTTVLSGGVDWSNTSIERRIDFSTPITDGTTLGTGWYVAGSSDVSGVLGVELRCVASSLLAGAYATADDSTAASPGRQAAAVCASGFRLLTGGAGPAGTKNPGVDQGATSVSGPYDHREWRIHQYLYQSAGGTMRALAICVPASTVTVTFTQAPAALSSATSGSITFVATDAVGETVTVGCYLDGVLRSCSSGVPVGYGPLDDGLHLFEVIATNRSGHRAWPKFSWTIDATVPTISGHTPTSGASLTGPFTITFSEPVTGVNATSMKVHAERANVDVAGTVARPSATTATWTPKTRLVPGERYRVSFTSAIHDTAGNPLTATFYTVRTSTTVENTSAALRRLWDVDAQALASGGKVIVSNLSGSRAELTFTATAGQTVSVFGIRTPGGGNADIYLDGVKKTTASFYAATTARARVYLSGALTAGTHTISIRPTGTKPAASTNTWVAIDNVNVGATIKQESALSQSFRRVASAAAYGGSYDTTNAATGTDTTPAQYRLTIVGTGFKLYATKTATSGSARVYVDGVLKATVNLNSATTISKALVYSTTFPIGVHAVRIEAVGTSTGANSSVNLDRITVD